MKGDFEGHSMFKQTPDGGMLEAGFGHIITEGGERLKGFYMKLDDKNGDNVTEFAMSKPTFETMLRLMGECMMAEIKMLGKRGGK